MMKNTIYILAAAMLLFASCQEDNNYTSLTGGELQIAPSVGLSSTRTNPAATDSQSASKFNDGDQISIEVVGSTKPISQSIYSLEDGKWSPLNGEYVVWENSTVTINAYYPTTSGTTTTTFALPADQSSEEAIAAADYMTYDGTITNSGDNTASFVLQRQTARVIINVDSFGSQYASGTKISDLKITSAKSSKEQSVATPMQVSPLIQGDGGFSTHYTALVIDADADATQNFIEAQVDGKTLYFTGVPKHEAGYSYTYNVTIGYDQVIIDQDNILVEDWNGITDTFLSNLAVKTPPVMGDYLYSHFDYSAQFNDSKTPIGIIYWVDSATNSAKAISIDEISGKSWALSAATAVNTTSSTSGVANMATIANSPGGFAAYPAFEWVDAKNDSPDYSTATTDVWYLPLSTELDIIDLNRDELLAAADAIFDYSSLLLTDYYWSSTEQSDATKAFYVYIDPSWDGMGYVTKTNTDAKTIASIEFNY